MSKKYEATLQVQDDKLFHFTGCMGIVMVCTLLLSEGWGTLIGIGVALGLSFGKEAYDEKYGTGWSWNDLYADGFGIAVGAIGAAWAVVW